MKENLHGQSIPQDVLEQIIAKANEINELLRPYAVALTSEERRNIPKMGEKTVSFVQKAYELAGANCDLCPSCLNMEQFGSDMDDATGLLVAENTMQQISEVIFDIKMLAGSEAYKQALLFYSYIKLLSSQDIPRARAIYDELKKRFPPRAKINAISIESGVINSASTEVN
jgi:hypothetical protein